MKILAISLKITINSETELAESCAKTVQDVPGTVLLDFRSRVESNYAILRYAARPEPALRALERLCDRILNAGNHKFDEKFEHLNGLLSDIVFTPVTGISLKMCRKLLIGFSREYAQNYEIPVFLFGKAGSERTATENRRIRGQSLSEINRQMASGELSPDMGAAEADKSKGVTFMGIRKYPVTFTFYLDVDSLDIAQEIADELGSQGRTIYEEDGTPRKDENGEIMREKGRFPNIDTLVMDLAEEQTTQVICNIRDYENPSIVQLYQAAKIVTENYFITILGSAILGALPLDAIRASLRFLPEGREIMKLPFEQQLAQLSEFLQFNIYGEFSPEWQIIDFRFSPPEDG